MASTSKDKKGPRVAALESMIGQRKVLPPIPKKKDINSGAGTRDFSKSKLMKYRRSKEIQKALNNIM